MFFTLQNCKITEGKAIVSPFPCLQQQQQKSLLDFHYWILNTSAWKYCLKIKEQMTNVMEVLKQLKQLPTALNKPCALTLLYADLLTVTLEPPKTVQAISCPRTLQSHAEALAHIE